MIIIEDRIMTCQNSGKNEKKRNNSITEMRAKLETSLKNIYL